MGELIIHFSRKEHGFAGHMAVPDRISVEMIVSAVNYLKEKRGITDITLYGMSMGTIFAALAANYAKVTNLILCSPTHVPSIQRGSRKKSNRNVDCI